MYDEIKIEAWKREEGSSPATYTWVDITEHVSRERDVAFDRGISSGKITSRTASPGTLSFTLRDFTGEVANPFYAVASPFSGPQINVGSWVRVIFEKQSWQKCLWFGKVSEVKPAKDLRLNNQADIVAKCIVNELNKELDLPTITTNKDLTEVVDEVLTELDITLAADQKEWGTVEATFPTIFDTASSTQNGLSEVAKAVMSELGYFYTEGSFNFVEGTGLANNPYSSGSFKFIVQGRDTREALAFTDAPVAYSSAGYLIKEDGDYVLTEDGGRIILNAATTIENLEGSIARMNYSVGLELANDVVVTVYPRDIDVADTTLFQYTSQPAIAAGETLEFEVDYKDPNIETQSIVALTANAPVATTDYTANTESDGTGTDMTSFLSVSASYGGAKISYTLENTHTTDTLYVTLLKARGRGIRIYQSVKTRSKNQSSIDVYGDSKLQLNLKYRSDPTDAKTIADSVLAAFKDPMKNVETISVCASASDQWELNSLFLEVGQPVKVPLLNASNVIEWTRFYINGMAWRGNVGRWYVTYKLSSTQASEV